MELEEEKLIDEIVGSSRTENDEATLRERLAWVSTVELPRHLASGDTASVDQDGHA